MKIGRIDNKFNTFHYPVKQLKCGTCKNCSFTKDYTTVKASSSKYMCNVYLKYIYALIALKSSIQEILNNY